MSINISISIRGAHLIALRHFSSQNIASPTECAPERGNEPLAQGNTLGNKGNISEYALKGQKRYCWEENAFAPPERNHHAAYNTQGAALGYMIAGLPGRPSPFQRSNSAAGDSIHKMTLEASALKNRGY